MDRRPWIVIAGGIGGVAVGLVMTTLPNVLGDHAPVLFYGGLAVAVVSGLSVAWGLLGRPGTDHQKDSPINIDQRVSSSNQTGGITAHSVAIGRSPRSLSGEAAVKVKGFILREMPPPRTVSVTVVWGDHEALRLAHQIKDWLEASGYEVDGVNQAMYTEPVLGLEINEFTNKIVVGSNVE